MALISIRNISIGFGGEDLLDRLCLEIHQGDRIGLLGRNGTGKTTLLKLICGEMSPDSGEIAVFGRIATAMLPQEIPQLPEATVYDVVARGLGESGALLAERRRLAFLSDAASSAKRGRIDTLLSIREGWSEAQRLDRTITRLDLPPDALFAELSAGLQRRTLLARALAVEPDVLLLDEPTNHLDIAAIDRLEAELANFSGTLVFITHDRAFLQRFARRIVLIDRGRADAWNCDYATFLKRQTERDEAEAARESVFDKKLAAEEAWIRTGIKARRTRNMGRVRALERLRQLRKERRQRPGAVSMQIQEARRSGNLVVAAEGIGYAWEGRPVIRGFSTTITRGDKVGIIGPNGAGKTTLLKLLLGELAPNQGRRLQGTRIEAAYFDQLRASLDLDRSVADNLAGGNDRIDVGGKNRHVIGYLQDFLFTPVRARSPVRILSGGERNRLLLARLFARPSNLLVMDEPTNDLDLETVELLEDRLAAYPGTLLLVSHDRAFLNNVVTSTLVLDGTGTVDEFVGGYDDWVRQRNVAVAQVAEPASRPASKRKAPKKEGEKTKLGFNEQRERKGLPERIEALEEEQKALYAAMADPEFYRTNGDKIAASRTRLEEIEEELSRDYKRWEYLESLK